MPAEASLAKLVTALQFAEPGALVRIDTMTGEVLEASDSESSAQDRAASGGHPERYQTVDVEVDEQDLAKRFCATLGDDNARRRLETALSSDQPIEAFENALYRAGIAHEWFPFRERQLGNVAKTWLEAQGIRFVDDLA
jgi:Uncharacterised protein family (UPF0158)